MIEEATPALGTAFLDVVLAGTTGPEGGSSLGGGGAATSHCAGGNGGSSAGFALGPLGMKGPIVGVFP